MKTFINAGKLLIEKNATNLRERFYEAPET